MLLIGGAIAGVLGLILLIIGAVQNSSLESQLLMAFGQPGTGTGLIVFGVILLLAGMHLLLSTSLKRRSSNTMLKKANAKCIGFFISAK